MEEEFLAVADKIKELLKSESSGHDYFHAIRVFNNALAIQKHEGGNRHIIGLASLIHDAYRPWEKKTGKSHFGLEALDKIKTLLKELKEDSSIVDSVVDIVRLHDVYDWTNKKEKVIELQIVQDADNLDAIGAIGIARTFAFGGTNNLDIYIPGENLDFENDFIESPNHRTSTIAHFYEKLLKLKDNMNTNTGKKLAKNRHKKMEEFLNEFFKEWEGKS